MAEARQELQFLYKSRWQAGGPGRRARQEAGQAGGGPGRSYSFYTRVDGRQEEGQAGGGGPGRRARQEAEARQEAGQAGVTVFIQESMAGRRARQEAAVFIRKPVEAAGRRRARQEAAGQAGGGGQAGGPGRKPSRPGRGGPDRRRARHGLDDLYKTFV